MSRFERLALWIALLAALGAFLGSAPQRRAMARPADDEQGAPFAVCAIWDLTVELAESPRFADARKERTDALMSPEHRAAAAEYERLRASYDELDPESEDEEEQAKVWELWQQLHDAWDKLSEFEEAIEEQRTAIQLADYRNAFDQVMEAAEAIAKDQGYTCVVSTMLPIDEREKQPEDVWDLWELAKFQAAAIFPKQADITADVRDDLKLE